MSIFNDNKKKKKKTPFDPFFDDDDDFFGDGFDNILKRMNEIMRRSIGNMDADQFKNIEPGKPIVSGFSVKIGPDGKPQIEQFGNVEPKKIPEIRPEREPMADINDEDSKIIITAELPGVSKEEIDITVSESGKKIDIDVPKKFHKTITLKEAVKSEVGRAHYKNGVLTIELIKKKAKKPRGKKIKVE